MKKVFFALLAWSISANAQELVPRHRYWYLLGAEAFIQNKTSTSLPEIDNSGFGLAGKGSLSRYWRSIVADVGLGYRVDKMKKNDVSVNTKAFFSELGGRYRLSNDWSLGPQLHFLFGQDVSFSDVGTNSDDKSLAVFAGVRLMKDFLDKNERFAWRLGLQGLTDLNISQRQVTYFQVVAEIAWPFNGSDESVAEVPPKTEVPVVAKVESPVKKEAKLKLNLRAAGVNFASGSATLLGHSKSTITELAQVLKKYDSEWEEVRIEGHTDATGPRQKNMELSDARAASVRKAFVDHGLAESKISSQGFGPDRPIDSQVSAEANAKNRRVELHLVGDQASEKFVKQLEGVIKRHSK